MQRNHSLLCVGMFGMFVCDIDEMLFSHAADGCLAIANPVSQSRHSIRVYLHSPTVTCSCTQHCSIAAQKYSCNCNTTRTVTTLTHLTTSVIPNYHHRSTPNVRVEVRARCCECVLKRPTGVKTVKFCAPVE